MNGSIKNVFHFYLNESIMAGEGCNSMLVFTLLNNYDPNMDNIERHAKQNIKEINWVQIQAIEASFLGSHDLDHDWI